MTNALGGDPPCACSTWSAVAGGGVPQLGATSRRHTAPPITRAADPYSNGSIAAITESPTIRTDRAGAADAQGTSGLWTTNDATNAPTATSATRTPPTNVLTPPWSPRTRPSTVAA